MTTPGTSQLEQALIDIAGWELWQAASGPTWREIARTALDAEETRRASHNGPREAILFEVAAVASRYEQDTPPASARHRWTDLRKIGGSVPSCPPRGLLLELAGRCVAWLENLDTQGKT